MIALVLAVAGVPAAVLAAGVPLAWRLMSPPETHAPRYDRALCRLRAQGWRP